MVLRYFYSIVLLLAVNCALGQQKFEKETRIKSNTVPQPALDCVDQFSDAKRIKWYREESQDGITLEAKFKMLDTKYSVEFDQTGKLLDLEVLTAFSYLEESVQNSIETYLNKTYNDYQIDKVQVQFSGDTQQVINTVNNETKGEKVVKKLELIVSAKVEGEWVAFEITFDEKGKHLSTLSIVSPNSDHLDF